MSQSKLPCPPLATTLVQQLEIALKFVAHERPTKFTRRMDIHGETKEVEISVRILKEKEEKPRIGFKP